MSADISNERAAGSRKDIRFDLEERTARFGEAIIAFCKKIPQNVVTLPLIGQLIRAGGSVGANYCEADDAVSKKECRKNIGTCKKEAREPKHWLRMIAVTISELPELVAEAQAPLAGGEGTAPDLQSDLSKLRMMAATVFSSLDIRHSLVIASFGI